MFQLIAEGPEPRQRWEEPLAPGHAYVLGRGPGCSLTVPWDQHISRKHVRVTCNANGVEVVRLSDARNPLFFAEGQVDQCHVLAGEHFVLGRTSFRVTGSRVAESPIQMDSVDADPVAEVTFDRQELLKVRFLDADKRIEVLSNLPEVIWGARSDSELHHRLLNLLLAGVMRAEAVAIVKLDDHEQVHVLHWDRRREVEGSFRPSKRLVVEAVTKRAGSVLHIWGSKDQPHQDYTVAQEFDWAYCTPVLESGRERWGFYIAGRSESPFGDGRRFDRRELQPDVRFTELVAEIISSVRRLNKLERQQAGLRQFFAPPILSALGGDLDTTLLEPRECDVTVLFCDLRGFSHQAEEAADNLLALLNRVSRALGVMTHEILEHGGVTGDFQGDAALGFWGWPFPSVDAPLNACRAALGIRKAFAAASEDEALSTFRVGVGIAHGRAVAGKIGTAEQVKVTVFGPVVNLASRLESLTKELRVPILLDAATTDIVRARLDRSIGRTRKLAKVLPFGMETPVLVSELLPPESEFPELSDKQVEEYERGVEHFIAGRWEEAYRAIHAMPPNDRAQDFLGLLIAQHNRAAPPGWDGVVRMQRK